MTGVATQVSPKWLVDLGARIFDRLRPARLLVGDHRRELLGRVRHKWLHAELHELFLEWFARLNLLQLHCELIHDLFRRAGWRNDALPSLPIVTGDRRRDRRDAGKKRRRLR